MTRNELIKAIYDSKDDWSCPDHPCDLPEEEGNVGECCLRCAEKQLAEYEAKIRAEAIIEFLTFCREHADAYDGNGWSLADLIELNIRFEKEKKDE